MISKILGQLTTETLGRSCFCFNTLDSTSTYIKKMWKALPDGHTVISREQGSGRGRQGKTFYSPKDDGLYFSFLLKDEKYLNDPLFTVKMSYILCKAIDALTETEDVTIKWVNDIYIGSKKLAGILCEALHDGTHNGIIVGIGINFVLNKAEVPSELRGKIGSLRDIAKKAYSKERLTALILNGVEEAFSDKISTPEFLALYRKRSAVLGKEIKVLKNNEFIKAAALDISEDGGLLVRYSDGVTEKLTAGEITTALE